MNNSFNFVETSLRVRYGETDQMGYVYYGNYAQYCEVGRVEWLRKLGISYREMETKGIMLPVRSLNIKFKQPARYDELITVKTKIQKMPSASIDFLYEIVNEKDEILAIAETVLVFIDIKKNRPVRCPDYILNKLI